MYSGTSEVMYAGGNLASSEAGSGTAAGTDAVSLLITRAVVSTIASVNAESLLKGTLPPLVDKQRRATIRSIFWKNIYFKYFCAVKNRGPSIQTGSFSKGNLLNLYKYALISMKSGGTYGALV
jgi:hypothetical protein